MNYNRKKLTAILFFAVGFLSLVVFKVTPEKVAADNLTTSLAADTAATYKAKCAACHTPKATKFYDAAKPDDEHVQVILKGKKGAKPPYMPGFEAKGMKEDEAKALNDYMRGLKAPK